MDFETRPDGRIACPFDHHSADYAENFRDIYDELRARSPLVWSDLHGGFWIASDYALVRELLMDPDTFTVDPGPERTGGIMIPAPPGSKHRALFVPGEADGPEHDKYRLALMPYFSKHQITTLDDLILRHVDATVDRLLTMDAFDVVSDLAIRVMYGVACEYLGLEVENPETFIKAIAHMVGTHSDDEFAAIDEQFRPSWQYLIDVIKDRRIRPGPGVISHLAQSKDPVFSDEEVQMMTLNVILGASDTTVSLLSQAVIHLSRDRALADRLRAEPELIPAAVEEFLRLYAVGMGNARTVTRDVEIAGVTMKKGDRVLPAVVSANHDPAKYPNPRAFDLDRGATHHLATGMGTHFCLGAWLAKSVSNHTLREFLTRVPDFKVDEDRVIHAANISILNYYELIPATTGA